MTDLETYYEARAAEAARLAETAGDERVRAVHHGFAQAYRERLAQVCGTAAKHAYAE